MNILITGATGFIGSRLIEELFQRGYDNIRVLTRNTDKATESCPFPIHAYHWNPQKQTIDTEAFTNVDVIFHLAGENIADGRWDSSKKKRIINSRTSSGELLINTIAKHCSKTVKLISASAIGIYGDRKDEQLDEKSSPGEDFLAEVCKSWEETVLNHSLAHLRSHCIRIGIVLSQNGGALKKMLPPFKAGVGGQLGDGKQYMSWIHLHDLVRQFIFLMENNCEHQTYNGVSPNPLRNKQFTKKLGHHLNRPTLFPVPEFALKTLFGEMSSILLAGQRVLPKHFEEAGFEYLYPTLDKAFSEIFQHESKGEETFKRYQWVPRPIDHVFDFFSDEMNLQKLVPPYLKFKVLNKSTETIEAGTLIDYQLHLHGIPMKWKTKINRFEKEKVFIDEQLKGPYQKWVHTHEFYPTKDGTLIKDEVVYKVPMGLLGQILSGPLVRRDINNIFSYRQNFIKNFFAKQEKVS